MQLSSRPTPRSAYALTVRAEALLSIARIRPTMCWCNSTRGTSALTSGFHFCHAAVILARVFNVSKGLRRRHMVPFRISGLPGKNQNGVCGRSALTGCLSTKPWARGNAQLQLCWSLSFHQIVSKYVALVGLATWIICGGYCNWSERLCHRN